MPVPSTIRARHSLHALPGRHAGFTLTELLVAITIIVAILGIAVGGLFGHKDTNRIFATEQMVTDFVRQARHAARSSGEPVELRISQVVNAAGLITGGRIAGVSRSSVWSQSFDNPANLGTLSTTPPTFTLGGGEAAQDPDPTTGLTLGRTGNGVWPVVLAGHAIPVATRQAMLQHQLVTSQFLVRGSDPNGAADGFFLGCAVRPPSAIATWNAITPAPTGTIGIEIPLVVLGGLSDQAAASSCIAGMKLVLIQFPVTLNGTSHNLYCWQLTGWVNQPGSPVVTTTITSPNLATDAAYGPANPICGDRWEDIGMLFDGTSLSLYRDGVALTTASTAGTPSATANVQVPLTQALPTPNLLVAPANETVFIGQLIPSGAAASEYADAPMDDVRIMRLGVDQVQDLPQTVVPEVHGSLVFRPDGTMTFNPDVVTTPDLPPLLLATPANGSPSAITITMPQGPMAVVPQSMASGTLLFCRRTHGMRDGGAGNSAVITIPVNGPPTSYLGTIGRDPSTMSNSYVVYTLPMSGP